MAIYPPPNFTEDINTFNPINWELSSNDGITEAFLNANFLKFPIAQGFETLNGINNLGSSTLSGAVNIQGLTTFNNNLVLQAGLPARTITFSDGTIQSSAAGALPPSGVVAGNYTLTNLTVASTGLITSASNGSLPASGVVAGNYTSSNITVNSAGIITSASNGSSSPNVISVQTFSMTGNFTFPAGTQYATIMISGAGGSAGASYYSGSAVSTGGGGGAGGFVYINRLPVEAGTIMGCSFVSGLATLYYLPIPNSIITTNYPIASANAGGNGNAGTSGGAGNGGIGAGATINLTGFGISGSNVASGVGITTSGSGQTTYGFNLLSYFNPLTQISPSVPPFNYGIGGYTVVNNGSANDYTVYPAGGAVCVVISYSS